jgi:hypothetical protein
MLKSFFTEWLQNYWLSTGIRESVWIYAFDQCAHLVALAVFAGAILIVDLRLLGAGVTRRSIREVARGAQPWMVGGFLTLVATGIPQLMSNATKEYFSEFFWYKMYALVAAVIFTFTMRHRVIMAEEGRVAPATGKIVGLVSLVLWSTVAITARLIGLLT